MSGTLTEYMVQQANEFNIRCDMIEQRITNIDEKLSAMEYNVNRLVNQLEVFLDTIPYTNPNSNSGGDMSYEKYLKRG